MRCASDLPRVGDAEPSPGHAVNPAPRSGPAAGGCAFERLRGDASQAKRPHPWGLDRAIHGANGPGLGPGWAWGAHLLPFLEEANLRVDLAKDVTDAVHDAVRSTSLSVYLCPSDALPPKPFSVADSSGALLTTLGFANYVGIGGTFEVSAYPDTATGVLFRNKGVRIADITDGTSSTLMVGERSATRSPQTTWVGMEMTVVGLNCGFAGQSKVYEVTGSAPYGATAVAGLDGKSARANSPERAIRVEPSRK